MRLTCEVETTYLLAQQSGEGSKSKRIRASITVGKKKNSRTEEIVIIVSTTKNVAGTQYKIHGNIDRVFSKFIGEGKATIRFNNPSHDLAISKADPAKLKEFLTLLKMSPQEQASASLAPLLPPKMKDLDKLPTKIVIKSRSDYPSRGFLPTIETVEACAIGLIRVDRRILSLANLNYLDLSNNSIKTIPEELHNVSLTELRLAGNQITELPVGLCVGNLAESLKTLDISRNKLMFLPRTFPNLKNLVQLKLDCNELEVLPRQFGKLKNLKYLSISSNKLAVLPYSFCMLSLESLDLFGNDFKPSGLVRRCSELSLPSLEELSARAVKKYRLPYNPQTLPVTSCHYLDSAKKCLCGVLCFSTYLHYIASINLCKLSLKVTTINQDGTTRAAIEIFLCSAKCLKLWKF